MRAPHEHSSTESERWGVIEQITSAYKVLLAQLTLLLRLVEDKISPPKMTAILAGTK
jgi:hypothetical protein